MRRAGLVLLVAVLGCSGGGEKKPGPKTEPAAEPAEIGDESEEPPAKPADASRSWNFDGLSLVDFPQGMIYGETNPHNHPATWSVVKRDDAPSPPNAFGVTACDNPKGAVFEVALVEGTSYDDLEAEVWMLAVAGEFDQGGGIIWRARDKDNYYVTRWNPIEGNLRFYVVVDSERKKLAEVDLTLEAGKWHRMRLVVEGSHFEVTMDDHPPLELDDRTLEGAGKIGLWTKTDAKTLFDDLSVVEL